MTNLLRQAIDAFEKLPDDAQNSLATRWLAMIQDEAEWERRFASTTDEQWDRMADEIRRHDSRDF